ncbi:hypothetical protein [Terricaulis sp.]|uniref:hypothetical protein n=1 Tax=Terricaulis sp. TaxID=2768686 RepID=UPI002AC37781|nr:hypothetical protein [Terricaulis sp.]MDZ4690058.1 hypothetical protein [Terricaulis sp.]
MLKRLLLVLGFGVLAGFCAIAFEASAQTSVALELIERARVSTSQRVQTQLLTRAEHTLQNSWARPVLWHAGASEALSGAYYAHGLVAQDTALLRQSANWAENTVRLAPVQPHAWIRLAALDEGGIANSLCRVTECLAHAWRVAPLLNGAGGCERLRIAYRVGALTSADARIDAYVQTHPRRIAAACLDFLPPAELYEALMRDAV